MTVDTILRLFSIIVLFFIMGILAGGLVVREMKRTTFTYDPWAIIKTRLVTWFLMALILGATTGYFFISPTDGWAKIITGALAMSLILTTVELIGSGAYLRWRSARKF